MQKFIAYALLIFNLISIPNAYAFVETRHWCGTYYEANEQSYLRIPRADIITGNTSCLLEEYTENVEKFGYEDIKLDFSLNKRNTWKKFNNQLIEIRGKLRNKNIDNTRFIRNRSI